MNERNDVVNHIQDRLGDAGSREIAEQVFDILRASNRVYWSDVNGLTIRDDVDLIAVAGSL